MAYLDSNGLVTFWNKIKANFAKQVGNVAGNDSVVVKLKNAAGNDIEGGSTTIAAASTTAAGVMSKTDKAKLDGIAAGAEVNVQSDWNQSDTSADDYIKNKPSVEVNTNKVTSWSTTTTDAHYPSEKLVKDSLDGKYAKPASGIPKTDLTSAVQASLDKADSAVQDVSGKEDKTNKVTSWSASTTDTNYPSEKLVKDSLDAKYVKPSGGIPKSDLASAVQTSLGKADTALQEHQDISGKENTSNKVTSWSSTVTDDHYPSEKLVKNYVDSAVAGGAAYQGPLASEAELTALTNYKSGWYWIASATWTSASLGLTVDSGNMIIAKAEAAAYAAANFNVIQSDIEAIPDSVINALS